MFKGLVLASLIPSPIELLQTDRHCRHPETWNQRGDSEHAEVFLPK